MIAAILNVLSVEESNFKWGKNSYGFRFCIKFDHRNDLFCIDFEKKVLYFPNPKYVPSCLLEIAWNFNASSL